MRKAVVPRRGDLVEDGEAALHDQAQFPAGAAGEAVNQRCALQHELGMTLWAMAERANDASAMAMAEETLEASIATFKDVADTAQVAAVQADLVRLREALPGKSGHTNGKFEARVL